MKIIDAHVHFSRIASFEECARGTSEVDYSECGYISEAAANGVVRSVCMGLAETASGGFPDARAATPMGADLAAGMNVSAGVYTPTGLNMPAGIYTPTGIYTSAGMHTPTGIYTPAGMYTCLGINPHTLSERSLAEAEELIKGGPGVVGLKIYAGYYHFDITDPVYDPAYRLSEKYDLAIVVHTGDTFSDRGLLKYAHPLRIDELAVAHPHMRIVACHMGVPWVFDACEVAAKNPNVYVDLSGMLVGNAAFIGRQADNPLILDRYRQALAFMESYDKVLYGSDWPLVPMGAYIGFCKKIIPQEEHEKVFYDNAMNVFKLKEDGI